MKRTARLLNSSLRTLILKGDDLPLRAPLDITIKAVHFETPPAPRALVNLLARYPGLFVSIHNPSAPEHYLLADYISKSEPN